MKKLTHIFSTGFSHYISQFYNVLVLLFSDIMFKHNQYLMTQLLIVAVYFP